MDAVLRTAQDREAGTTSTCNISKKGAATAAPFASHDL